MSRYIDADKLKEECYKFANDVSRSAMAFVQGQINAAPTADVIEVVRCKDCKHLKIINDGKVYAKCTMTDFEFLPFGTDTREHYCGYGERSENGKS